MQFILRDIQSFRCRAPQRMVHKGHNAHLPLQEVLRASMARIAIAELRLGVAGSEHDLPAIFPLTADVAKLLGFFISEGNYNIQEACSYNLAITGSEHAETIKCCAGGAFNTYATMTEGHPTTRVIYGIEGEWERSKQVYFGGKLIYLLFRYVFGISGGSYNKRLPNIVYHLNDQLLSDLLSSLFTGDGSAFYRPEKSDCIINYTTASETLRQELSFAPDLPGNEPTDSRTL